MTDDVGSRLRRARQLAGPRASGRDYLTTRKLGLLAGKSETLVSLIETGRVKHPRAETLARIADVLGISLEWLVYGRGDEPDELSVRRAVDAAASAGPQCA